MMPGAHVVIFLIALIENWLFVDDGVSALAVDVMTCEEVDEDVVDEEVGEEVKMTPIKLGSGGIGGEAWPTCRSAC